MSSYTVTSVTPCERWAGFVGQFGQGHCFTRAAGHGETQGVQVTWIRTWPAAEWILIKRPRATEIPTWRYDLPSADMCGLAIEQILHLLIWL